MRQNFLSALLFFTTVALFEVSLVSSHTLRKTKANKFAGFWRLLPPTADGVLEDIPPNRTVSITMAPKRFTTIRVSIKVANTMITTLNILRPKNADDSYKIRMGAMSSTRIRTPLDLVSMEQFILKWFPVLDNMNIVDGNLVLKSSNATLVCTK